MAGTVISSARVAQPHRQRPQLQGGGVPLGSCGLGAALTAVPLAEAPVPQALACGVLVWGFSRPARRLSVPRALAVFFLPATHVTLPPPSFPLPAAPPLPPPPSPRPTQIAMKYSECSSFKAGDNLGWFPRGKIGGKF